MRWLLSGCLLGGIGALLKHWQWPYASWVSIAGFSLLVIGFFYWLSSFGGRSYASGGDGGSDSSGGNDGFCSVSDAGCSGGDGGGD